MNNFEKLDAYIRGCIEDGLFPGAVVLVGNEKEDLFFEAYGFAELVPEKRPMKRDAIFDMASLTKPVATAPSVLLLQELKKLSLGDRIADYLMEFKQSAYSEVTIMEILIHTSGVPAWYPLYLVSNQNEEMIKFIAALSPKFERNKGVEYSCLNYIILNELVKRVSGMSLDKFSQKKIYEGLEMIDTVFSPGKELKPRCVTTELGNDYEKEVCNNYNAKVDVKWRTYPIRGEVHDGNSYYGFGGVTGNAGLFSTAQDIARFVRSILNEKGILKRKTVRAMIKNYTVGLEQGRGIGWGVASKFAGKYFSKQTFGHTGFTGVCLYADPVTDLFVILLTNTVHPRVRKGILDEVRPRVCDLVYKAVFEID